MSTAIVARASEFFQRRASGYRGQFDAARPARQQQRKPETAPPDRSRKTPPSFRAEMGDDRVPLNKPRLTNPTDRAPIAPAGRFQNQDIRTIVFKSISVYQCPHAKKHRKNDRLMRFRSCRHCNITASC